MNSKMGVCSSVTAEQQFWLDTQTVEIVVAGTKATWSKSELQLSSGIRQV